MSSRSNIIKAVFALFVVLVLLYVFKQNDKSDENTGGESSSINLETSEDLVPKKTRPKKEFKLDDDEFKPQLDLMEKSSEMNKNSPSYSYTGGSRVNLEESVEAMSPFSNFYSEGYGNDVEEFLKKQFDIPDGIRYATPSGYNQLGAKRPKDALGNNIYTPKLETIYTSPLNTFSENFSTDFTDEISESLIKRKTSPASKRISDLTKGNQSMRLISK